MALHERTIAYRVITTEAHLYAIHTVLSGEQISGRNGGYETFPFDIDSSG